MVKRITVSLTQDQLNQVLKSLEWGLYSDDATADEKKHNAFVIRIMHTIVKQELKQKQEDLAKARVNLLKKH